MTTVYPLLQAVIALVASKLAVSPLDVPDLELEFLAVGILDGSAVSIRRAGGAVAWFSLGQDSAEKVGANVRLERILLFSHNTPRSWRRLWDARDNKRTSRDWSFHVADVGTLLEAVPVSRMAPGNVRSRIAHGISRTPGISRTVTGGAQVRTSSSSGRPLRGALALLPTWAVEILQAKSVVLDPLKLSPR